MDRKTLHGNGQFLYEVIRLYTSYYGEQLVFEAPYQKFLKNFTPIKK